MSESDPAIDALYDAWSAAFRRSDVDAVIELLTPDYVLWAAGAPPLIGRTSLRGTLERTFALAEVAPGFELEERIVSGDIAIDRGWDRQEVRPKDGGAPRFGRQRVILVLRRDADGKWRFARGFSQPGPSE